MALLLNCLFIFFARIVDVSFGTLSTVLVVRGKRMAGAIIGFIDIVIWFLVVRQALTINDAAYIVALFYASGYGVGTFVGSYVEEKLAMGDASVQVITRGLRHDLIDVLRSHDFAVSSMTCDGKDGQNLLLIIEITRKKIKVVRKIINDIAPDSFVIISDVQKVINGYVK